MERLLQERQQFENLLYDYLINETDDLILLNVNNFNNFNFIPEDFWEPVTVCLTIDQVSNLETVTKTCECIICKDIKSDFKNLSCCNNDMCEECIINWFTKSVHCPFCKQDQRESSQRESSQRESSQRESSQRESSQRESSQRESSQRESSQRESSQNII
jgi:hypothetical protein